MFDALDVVVIIAVTFTVGFVLGFVMGVYLWMTEHADGRAGSQRVRDS